MGRFSIFALLRNAKRQGWLTPRRWRIELPIRLKISSDSGGLEYQTKTFDVSRGGIFVPDLQLQPGTSCYVSLSLRGLCFIQCQAKVVRLTKEPHGGYPVGIGLNLLGLTTLEQWKLKSFLSACANQV